VSNAAAIHNRLPQAGGVSPFEKLFGRKPSVNKFRPFGCLAYREAIGSVIYLAVRTRPDIAVAVSILSKHVQEPRPAHWERVKRILRYLKGTMTQGLQYTAAPGERSSLSIHCDADWGTDPEDRRSRTGVVRHLGGNVVSWTSRKQTTPAVSSCEAEYAALFEAGRDAVWIRGLLCEVGQCPAKEPTLVYQTTRLPSRGLKADCEKSSTSSSSITLRSISFRVDKSS
jgi:hypothetical protein